MNNLSVYSNFFILVSFVVTAGIFFFMCTVVKETVNNIIKHSAASFIHLSQYVKNDQFIIEISHDGKGLDQASFERLLKEHKGMGLKNISSGLQACNGQVAFFMQEKVYFASFSIPMQPKGIIMVEE
ncbi:MAG TPA: ATP-binding protein [Flavisolibacter sp.]|jgi:signal transduction histidine kinase|nr:ATP-binding protein [Flavisolibacter sp.]